MKYIIALIILFLMGLFGVSFDIADGWLLVWYWKGKERKYFKLVKLNPWK